LDWKLFLTTFVTIFVAELGDKTQFAAIAASAQSRSVLPVLLAVVLGLSLAGVLGVGLGRVLGEFLEPGVMKWISGLLFIGVGVWVLVSK
jgi:putative Ca2+/H+ antiporter (TMEM165/GDT1 family)